MIILFFAALIAGIAGAVLSGKKFRNTGQKKYLVILIVCTIISLVGLFFIAATLWLAWAVSVQPPD
ncbi:MAG: hypothetical protein K5770_10935 [Lachnospiraceae bacterium]|nr:hypothetical protein [Lachnospiraceae bacterium]